MVKWGSESNGLENLTYHTFIQDKDKIYWEDETKFTKLIEENLEHKDYSRIEYFSVLPVKDYPEQFAVFLSISNSMIVEILILLFMKMIKCYLRNYKIVNKVSWFRQVYLILKKYIKYIIYLMTDMINH
jgi:hypothetical protein